MCNIPTFILHLFFFSTILAEICWILYLKKKNIWNASHHEIKASHLRFPITWCTHSTVSQSVLSHSRYKLCAGWPGKPFMLHLAFHIELYRPYTVKDYIHTIVTFSLEMNVPWLKSKQETDIKCFLYTCSVIQNNKVYNVYFDKLKRYLQN